MPQADDYRETNAFHNDALYVEREYDFSKDGGAQEVIDLLKVNAAMVIEEVYVKVVDAVLSGGSATVEIGVKGGDTDAIMAATGPGGLTAGLVIDGASASKRLKLAADAEISMEIKVADLTAGKIKVSMVLRPF